MMQYETKSSQFASKAIQQTNYSALSSLPKQYINQVSAEGDIFLTAPARCDKLWKEFRRQDFTNVQIPYKTAQMIYKECQVDIKLLLKINNAKDFFDLFDQDNDGFLNEDEQIQVFSVIKEKMQQVANLLLQIQQYMSFKHLMIAIRQLESKICDYQNTLRKKIYKGELDTYDQIGKEKLDDFYSKYYDLFQNFEQTRNLRMMEQEQKQNEETHQLSEKLTRNTEFLKVKPKRKLKDLQTQEKLVSLDERVEEAIDFRRELKNLEKSEQQRVQDEQQQRIDNQLEELQRKHKKKMDQLKAKLEQQEHKLIIQLNKEYGVLLKQISLHSNEIERIQSSATQNAIKKGKDEGELKRMKERARIQNFIISETKRMNTTSTHNNNNNNNNNDETKSMSISPRSPQNIQNQRGTSGMHELKQIIQKSNYTQFYIKKKYGADLPVNFKREPYRLIGDNHERIEKILSVKKKNPHDILPSLTELYDYKLNQIHQNSTQKTETELIQDKLIKKNFISEKLQVY